MATRNKRVQPENYNHPKYTVGTRVYIHAHIVRGDVIRTRRDGAVTAVKECVRGWMEYTVAFDDGRTEQVAGCWLTEGGK